MCPVGRVCGGGRVLYPGGGRVTLPVGGGGSFHLMFADEVRDNHWILVIHKDASNSLFRHLTPFYKIKTKATYVSGASNSYEGWEV